VRLTSYVQNLKSMITKPRATSIAGLVALLLACSYIYLLGSQVSRGIAEPGASWAVPMGQPAVTPSYGTDATATSSPTATRTATPTNPSGSPTGTPTYTPISYTPTPAYLVYIVQPGDTLSGIARRFGTTVQAIMELNSLTSDLLSIGQELLIPGTRVASTPLAAPSSTATNVAIASTSTPTPTPTATFSPIPTSTASPSTATPQPTAASLGTSQSGEPLVMAFYYAWFGLDQWSGDKVPDIPAVPYASSDRNAIIRHVEQAKGAGIDAFAVAWYGPQTRNNQTETNFRTLLDVAGQRGFHATVDFETRSPFFHSQADIVNALRYLINNHAAHSAFLRYEGKPLIFFWAVQNVFTAQGQSAIDAWASIRQQVDPQHNTLWISEGANIEFLRVFDGHHLYNITWKPPVDVNITLSRWGNNVRDYNARHATQRLWVATVMPGYNDLYIEGRPNRFAHDRRNGAYYRETWQAAMNSSPDLIMITSFNEWLEGTQIEPSVSYGQLYLELTSELSGVFKASRR
jgi:LysM repeat protein